MSSFKTIKMKKAKDFLATKEAVKEARVSLEQKTEKAFQEFANNRMKASGSAHITWLD